MKPRTIVIAAGIVVFAVAVTLTLMREVEREEAQLARSITGVVELSPKLLSSGRADVVRTDRLALMLVEPGTDHVVALRIESPVVPPQTIRIGAGDFRGGEPSADAEYQLVGVTDKDGELYQVTPGEVFGRTEKRVRLGTEKVRLVLDEPHTGQAPRLDGAARQPGGYGALPPGVPVLRAAEGAGSADTITIGGTVRLGEGVPAGERLVVRLYVLDDPSQTRVLLYRDVSFPFRFRARPAVGMSGRPERSAYRVEAHLDNDGRPAEVGADEPVARTEGAVPLGTGDVALTLRASP